jgi:hypothetical protein
MHILESLNLGWFMLHVLGVIPSHAQVSSINVFASSYEMQQGSCFSPFVKGCFGP